MITGYFLSLTLERYWAIKEPYKYVAWFTDNRNTWWLGLPPIFGALLAVGPLLGWGRYDHPEDFSPGSMKHLIGLRIVGLIFSRSKF